MIGMQAVTGKHATTAPGIEEIVDALGKVAANQQVMSDILKQSCITLRMATESIEALERKVAALERVNVLFANKLGELEHRVFKMEGPNNEHLHQ